jgi:hypothetical protein
MDTHQKWSLHADYHGDPSVGIFSWGYEFIFGHSPIESNLPAEDESKSRMEIKEAFAAFLETFNDGKPNSIMFMDEIEAENKMWEGINKDGEE